MSTHHCIEQRFAGVGQPAATNGGASRNTTVFGVMAMTWCASAILSLSAGVFGQTNSPPASEDHRNAFLVDTMEVDLVDHWEMVGRSRIGMSHWGFFDIWRPMSEIVIEPSKAGHRVHGLQRAGLKLPLPEAIRFRILSDTAYLWVVLGDSAGRRVSSMIPVPGLHPHRWCTVEVPLSKTVPFGVGAEPIVDFDMIAFLTRESAGELAERPVHIGLRNLEAIYPAGTGPTHPEVTEASIREMLAPLPAMLVKIDALLEQAHARGLDTRYPRVSRNVLERYRTEVFSMLHPHDPTVAQRTARFLLDCAGRTQAELETMLAKPDRVVQMPKVTLADLHTEQGSFFAGDRPVMLAGVVGWFGPDYFEQLSVSGYSVVSMEIGPSATLPEEHRTNPAAADGPLAILDAAARHNMVCDLLVSPHYFPDWARQKWPSTDATGWRRETNPFMPWTITDPHFREVVAKHLEVLIPLVREHPSLLSYDLINEAWYRLLPDFEHGQWSQYRQAHPQVPEWQALSALVTDNVTEFVRWYVDELHKHDRDHPVHIKVIDTVDVLSVDREALGDLLTANGMDAMPSWPDWTGRLAADLAWPFLRHDFHRSLQPNKPIMDGEYHISGGLWSMPSNYFRAALLGLALHGRDMHSVWSYDRVDDVSIYWHANGVEVLGRTALDLLRLAPEIHAFQRQRGPLAIYYGGTGTGNAYRACLFQDVDVTVMTDRRILTDGLGECRLLVVPAGSELPPEVRERIATWGQSGGHVVDCHAGEDVTVTWQSVQEAVEQAGLPRAVHVGQWGVECRSITLGDRRLFYLINHGRKDTVARCDSDWPLTEAVDLFTQQRLDASNINLDPLEVRLIEVK